MRLLALILFLSAASAHATDFTVSLSTTNASRLADAFECTGTPAEKHSCILEKIRQALKRHVMAFEGDVAGRNQRMDVEQNFGFQ